MTSGCCAGTTTSIWNRQGLSTLAKQKWWRQKVVRWVTVQDGWAATVNAPPTARCGVRFVDELIGAYQLLPRPEGGAWGTAGYGLP